MNETDAKLKRQEESAKKDLETWPKHLKDRCAQCQKRIVGKDDDAMVCIQCGGRNRRIK